MTRWYKVIARHMHVNRPLVRWRDNGALNEPATALLLGAIPYISIMTFFCLSLVVPLSSSSSSTERELTPVVANKGAPTTCFRQCIRHVLYGCRLVRRLRVNITVLHSATCNKSIHFCRCVIGCEKRGRTHHHSSRQLSGRKSNRKLTSRKVHLCPLGVS
jgi:hypothetical protein